MDIPKYNASYYFVNPVTTRYWPSKTQMILAPFLGGMWPPSRMGSLLDLGS